MALTAHQLKIIRKFSAMYQYDFTHLKRVIKGFVGDAREREIRNIEYLLKNPPKPQVKSDPFAKKNILKIKPDNDKVNL